MAPSIPSTTWTEEQVRQLVAREELSYQNIKLPYGIETGGDDRGATADAILPADLSGKTVVDIGSLNGFFCFEALKRGAARAVGIEVNPDSVRKARLLADCLGLPAEFRVGDIETDEFPESFDYVLCLNVLHHLKNPVATLDKLGAMTRDRLVLEVASIGAHDRKKLKLSPMAAYFLARAPILYVQATGRRRSGQKFFITPEAIRNLLLSHRTIYSGVEIRKSAHKDRFVAIARKRVIDTLVVIAGPTSAGKSTLVARVLAGKAAALERVWDCPGTAPWTAINANQLSDLTEPRIERLLFHYDILHPYFHSVKTFARDELLEVLTTVRRLLFVTLHVPPDILRRQLEQSEIAPKTRRGKFTGNHRHLQIQRWYEQPARVEEIYREWFAFAQSRSREHYVVQPHAGDKIQTLKEFLSSPHFSPTA